jgi:ketosteroid isomerase-like protein
MADKMQDHSPMRTDEHDRDRSQVEALLQYWSVQDVEQTLDCLADDVIYQLYICRSALPFGGEMTGKPAVRDLLFDILAHFDYLHYEPVILNVSGGVARIHTHYVMRHRASGEHLAGSKRFVCTLQDGLITRVFEYHDVALIEAFMRHANGRIAARAATAAML